MPQATVDDNENHMQDVSGAELKALRKDYLKKKKKSITNAGVESHLFIKAENLQQLDRQQETGLVELVPDVEEPLQVPAAQRVQHSSVH